MKQNTPIPFAANEVRLCLREWFVTAGILAVLLWLIPHGWKRIEPVTDQPNYRMPFSLGNDYWMFQRIGRTACAQGKIPFIGDSVVWGHYVSSDQTLPHYLNQLTGTDRFANLGVDGIHPAAMTGLINYYSRAISGRKVILHGNLLWTSSAKQDLQTSKEFPFNHPDLVPQFIPNIPCYKRSISDKLAIVIGRQLPFMGWAKHLRIAYFDGIDLPAWTLDHPYRNPLRRITLQLPSPDEPLSPVPIAKPWTERELARYNAAWVELDTSIQWRSFKRVLAILLERKNQVFVLLGPLNEHMLTPPSLVRYQKRKAGVEAWLKSQNVPHYVPVPLPSEQYADASHPLSEGYARLASQLLQNEAFKGFCDLDVQESHSP